LWFLSLCLRVFQQSYPFPPKKQGLSVLLFVIPFFVFGLKSIFNSPTHSTYKAGIEWCAAFCDYFVFGLRVFFNSPTHPT
jgi:hypothetical protein